ncbi:hypothetical protein [Falsiroseomonas sp. E2-1-a20]|uniref:hypothetical protein n=1 Tax=Falsiroseomonas sp. E2-1-a20 TaxID=3239300 RepID=UPI003F3EF98B
MQKTVWRTAFLAFALTLSCAWILVVLRDRAETLDQAQDRLVATARVLEQHADRAFETGDRVLRAIVEIAQPVDLADPEEAMRIHIQIRRMIADGPQISAA